MRVFFSTQSGSLRLFDALADALDGMVGVQRRGFAVADSWAYVQWLDANPDFERRDHVLVKEWEITSQRSGKPDLECLARYEAELGDPDLFGAIIADRRLIMGPDCTYSQDYRRRFSDDELLCILEAGLKAVDHAFTELKPDLAISFVAVTMLDYLVYLFAKARNVTFLNLRPTRIADRVIYGSTLNDPAPEFLQVYQRCLEQGSDKVDEARECIQRVRTLHGRYEGVVRPSKTPTQRVTVRGGLLRAGVRQLKMYRKYRASIAVRDNHVPGVLRPLFFFSVVNPVRARYVEATLRRSYLNPDELQGRRYAFYPLHSEPEVSMLVYGRPFVNQIEVIRALATSLPADMILVVKEHPWMVGKRSLSAYRKILAIPRVRLVSPHLDGRTLIQTATLVTVLASSIALEAAMLRRPALTFGHVPFNALPDSMVRRCADLTRLPHAVRDLIETHHHDEHSLEAYVAAVLELSVGVQFYTTLLGRKGAHAERSASFDEEIVRLAAYTVRRLDPGGILGTSPAGAPLQSPGPAVRSRVE